ncbi:MAG: DUF3825 domain-containing protein [Desulfovibrionaceae bacterium]|nr:DUF3825 domain-containing protein [Desulfovibrionaceae bacterium]
MIQGYISYFRMKKGIGFIAADDGGSYFFHISKILNEDAYQGSPVKFAAEAAEEKSDKAVDIMVLPARQTAFGAIKFHNRKEMFGSISSADGDYAFTQVTSNTVFSPDQIVSFAVRFIKMPNEDVKRVAYDILPVESDRIVHGVIAEWNGESGIMRAEDGQEFPFTDEIAIMPEAIRTGMEASAVIEEGKALFVKAQTQEPGIMAVARVVNLNPRQNYALVSGPGIPRAIIGNPDPALRHGCYISGEFHKNARGFECTRHAMIPYDRVLHGLVIDGGTRVRLINCGNYPALELPRGVLVGKKDTAWVPQDGEVCEFLLDKDEHVAIARKGYDLHCFADLGDEDRALDELAAKAHPGDRWDFLSTPVRVKPILWNYLFQTFAKLQSEDRERPAGSLPAIMDFEVSPEDNPRDAGEYAAFNTGLIDRFYQDIFALFKKVSQPRPGRPLYRLLAFDVRGTGYGQLLAYLDPLPRRARYFTSTSDLVFDAEARIDTNFEHILSDRSYRLIPDVELQNCEDRFAVEQRLNSLLQNAIRTVQNRICWNYKTAVPQYYPIKKKIQFLLPLCLDPGIPDKVDAVLVVEKVGKAYQAFTVLRPDWAYNNARLIARTDSDWLTPAKIQAGDCSDMF